MTQAQGSERPQEGTPAPEEERFEAAQPAEAAQHLRMMEALLFAATEPLDEKTLRVRMPEEADIPGLLQELAEAYSRRGVNLVRVAGKWAFRTAPDLHFLLQEHRQDTRKLSRAALETLAIIAYHQPVTRAEIEEIRGVAISKGTLDLLMEIGWVRMRGRRRTPGRPVTYGTSDSFLEHFGLESMKDLPGIDELRGAGLLEGEVPQGLLSLTEGREEDPLEEGDDGGDRFEETDEVGAGGEVIPFGGTAGGARHDAAEEAGEEDEEAGFGEPDYETAEDLDDDNDGQR